MDPLVNYDVDVRLNTHPTYWHCEPGWEWRARPLGDYLLWYVMDGVGLMRLGTCAWELQAGSCFVFAPGAQPHGTQDPRRRLVVYGMHFDIVNHEEHVLAETVLPSPGHVVRDTGFFATLAHRCHVSARRGDALSVQQSRVFLRAMLLHIWEETLYPAPSNLDLALEALMSAVQREPGRRWRVDEMARRVHLSRAQFVRRFRAAAGLSPARFIMHTRLERARQLIQETNMTMGQIAAGLGYEHVSFFSRQYKRYAGHPPSALRRQPQNGDGGTKNNASPERSRRGQ